MSYIIAVAGLPASGKSSLAEYLTKETHIPLICKDSIKEALFDTIGFHSRKEKTVLNRASLKIMFYAGKQIIKTGQNVILENNFENDAYPYFEMLLKDPNVQCITISVGGDTKVIYERYVKRNRDPSRHRGHVLSTEYPEKKKPGQIPEPISFEEFCQGFQERGMTDFKIGESVIYVDATDFSKVRYEDILLELKEKLK